MGAADPSSDWNAPAEHWGNYEEVAAAPRPPAGKEQSGDNKVKLRDGWSETESIDCRNYGLCVQIV